MDDSNTVTSRLMYHIVRLIVVAAQVLTSTRMVSNLANVGSLQTPLEHSRCECILEITSAACSIGGMMSTTLLKTSKQSLVLGLRYWHPQGRVLINTLSASRKHTAPWCCSKC